MHFRRQRDILLTLQERCSRLTLAGRLHSKDATDTADAIIDQLAALPSTAVQTITHDNGGEFLPAMSGSKTPSALSPEAGTFPDLRCYCVALQLQK